MTNHKLEIKLDRMLKLEELAKEARAEFESEQAEAKRVLEKVEVNGRIVRPNYPAKERV